MPKRKAVTVRNHRAKKLLLQEQSCPVCSVYFFIGLFAIIALFFSAVILVEKYVANAGVITAVCSAVGSSAGCVTVQHSTYGTLFNIDNPVYGIIGFTALAALAFWTQGTQNVWTRRLTILGGIIAGLFAGWFLYVQAFLLHTYCVYCVVVDTISIGLLIAAVFLWISRK